ncbi:MAG: hypothetical protein HOA22_00915 [Gammaproteobacteria bacterium]|nr:hypothetical protein [Gammaproteobacteria bacterium]
MIDAISNAAMPMRPPGNGQGGASLTDEQKQLISDTLSEYDADSLTEADATSIVSAFQDAGIQPGKGLAETMEAAGFDARAVGEMADVQGPPPGQGLGPQEKDGGINLSEDMMEELYTLLEQYYSEETADEERSSLMNAIRGVMGQEDNLFSASA